MRIGDYKTAIKAFKQVLFMYENHAFAHYYLAECYHRLVMIDDSIVHLATFQGIIEKDPKWAEYAKEFGLCQKK